MELLIEHLGHGLMLSLLLSLPCVLMAAIIGLVVGILQAVTQVQEQTIAAAPKIIGVFGILLVGGGLMMNMLTDYVRESMQVAFNEIPQDGIFILPPQRALKSGQARAKAFFEIQSKEGLNSDKLKSYASQWQAPTQDDSANKLLKTRLKPGGGNALGISEQMVLERNKKH